MDAWRLTLAPFAEDLTGRDAAVFGGRWSPMEQRALYLGLSPTLCALETLIQCSEMPRMALKLVQVHLPDHEQLYLEPEPEELPAGWSATPVDSASMEYGSAWLHAGDQLGLILPSAVMPTARKILINPAHPAMHQVHIVSISDFSYCPPCPPLACGRLRSTSDVNHDPASYLPGQE